MPIRCRKCEQEIKDGQQFIRIREDRTQREMVLYHAEHAPAPCRVRKLTPALRQAIEDY